MDVREGNWGHQDEVFHDVRENVSDVCIRKGFCLAGVTETRPQYLDKLNVGSDQRDAG